MFIDTETLGVGTARGKLHTATATGTDYWVATYDGDRNNNKVASGSGEEPVTVHFAAVAVLPAFAMRAGT